MRKWMQRLSCKLCALGLVLAFSLALAGHFTRQRMALLEVRAADSLAQALLEASARSSLAEASRQAHAALEQAGKAAKTVTLTPPRDENAEPDMLELSCPGGVPFEEVIRRQTLNRDEELLVTLLMQTPLTRDVTREEVRQLVLDLKYHCFLDGYYYCKAEPDPALQRRKRQVWAMESAVIDSLYALVRAAEGVELTPESLRDPLRLLQSIDGDALLAAAEQLAGDYRRNFAVNDHPELHAGILRYFDSYVKTVSHLRDLLTAARGSSNTALGLAGLLGRAQTVYLSVLDTVDMGLRFKEYTNRVYAEHVDGVTLYTRSGVYRRLAASGLRIPVAGPTD